MVGGTFRAPEIGITSFTVTRDVDKTGDVTNVEFAAADIVVSGEGTGNTNSGIIYGVVTGTSPNLVVSFYKASGAASARLASATSTKAGISAIAMLTS